MFIYGHCLAEGNVEVCSSFRFQVIRDNDIMQDKSQKVGIHVLEGMSGAPHTHDTCSNGPFVRGLSAWEGYLSMYLFAHFLVLGPGPKGTGVM